MSRGFGPPVSRARDKDRTELRIGVADGRLVRIARGLYADVDAPVTEHRSLVEVMAAVPRGIVCLLSALRFHGIGTQNPHNVWLAIDMKAWKPRTELPVQIVRFSGRALAFGIVVKEIEGTKVRVTSVAKTVADCFKYRNKIGVDVAIEALREVLQRKLATIDDVLAAARVCRVANVMRPYLEALA